MSEAKRGRPRAVPIEMVKAIHVAGLERIELERLRDRVERLLMALQEATEGGPAATPGEWAPPVDLCESEDAIFVRVELPGLQPADIKIGLTNTQLRICGEKRKSAPRIRVKSHLCSERSYGHFSRVLSLRWTISVSDATADLVDGVLTVKLPKRRDRRGAEFKVPIRECSNK